MHLRTLLVVIHGCFGIMSVHIYKKDDVLLYSPADIFGGRYLFFYYSVLLLKKEVLEFAVKRHSVLSHCAFFFSARSEK